MGQIAVNFKFSTTGVNFIHFKINCQLNELNSVINLVRIILIFNGSNYFMLGFFFGYNGQRYLKLTI